MSLERDRQVLRELADRCARIAALPVQEEKRMLWKKLNGLRPERPMVIIDQICWSELNAGGELTLVCQDERCRDYEQTLRRILYQWAHFPVDSVVDSFIRVPMAVHNSGFGIGSKENILTINPTSEVSSHWYHNLFRSPEDVEKIQTPVITHDANETKSRMEMAEWLFGGIMETRPEGVNPYLSIWDPICTWMGPEGVLTALADQPELMHAMAGKLSNGYLSMLDQLEALGVLCHHQSLIHCTGAFTDELPGQNFNPQKPRTADIWMMGLAQLFAAVSPAMFAEYELAYSMPLFERFGLVYYGCCDPLHDKMKQVRAIPRLRKVSMSPWANQAKGAQEIGADFVFSRKPNPAFVAMHTFDERLIEEEFRQTLALCAQNGCPVEFILKDISTVCGKPERLDKWADIAMRCVCA